MQLAILKPYLIAEALGRIVTQTVTAHGPRNGVPPRIVRVRGDMPLRVLRCWTPTACDQHHLKVRHQALEITRISGGSPLPDSRDVPLHAAKNISKIIYLKCMTTGIYIPFLACSIIFTYPESGAQIKNNPTFSTGASSAPRRSA